MAEWKTRNGSAARKRLVLSTEGTTLDASVKAESESMSGRVLFPISGRDEVVSGVVDPVAPDRMSIGAA